MKKSFTLLELIVVVIIIGILATLALGQYIKVAEKARSAEGKHLLGLIRAAEIRYKAEKDAYTTTATSLDVDYTTPKYFTVTNVGTSSGNLATVTRSGTGATTYPYTLSIDVNGTITCAVAGSAGCKAAGY